MTGNDMCHFLKSKKDDTRNTGDSNQIPNKNRQLGEAATGDDVRTRA